MSRLASTRNTTPQTALGKADDQEAEQATTAPLLASYLLPPSSAARLVRFYNSPMGLLLSLSEIAAVGLCQHGLMHNRSDLPSICAFFVWPSLLTRLAMLDRRAVFQLLWHFEWWFVPINYCVLARALAAMLGNNPGRLHAIVAVTTSVVPSLCADAYALRRDWPALNITLSLMNVLLMGVASWRQLFQGAKYDLPLFLGKGRGCAAWQTEEIERGRSIEAGSRRVRTLSDLPAS